MKIVAIYKYKGRETDIIKCKYFLLGFIPYFSYFKRWHGLKEAMKITKRYYLNEKKNIIYYGLSKEKILYEELKRNIK